MPPDPRSRGSSQPKMHASNSKASTHHFSTDTTLEASHVCVVDAQGKILKEAKVASEPEALTAWFAAHGTPMARIGLEAGPLSQWLFAKMKAAGLAVELI